MKGFFRRISPKRAVTDFADHWAQPTPHRWGILGVAIASTFAIFMTFVPNSTRIEPRPPEVIFISTWADDRTDAEIIAANCANQRLKNEIEVRLAERAELRREMYVALGRATFVDVDSIEEDIQAERAAAAANPVEKEEQPGLSLEEYCAGAVSDAAAP